MTSSARSRLTARGALLGLFGMSLMACLLAVWREADALAGLGYCAGCLLAPLYARRNAQLRIVVSAPAAFLLALVVTEVLTVRGTSRHGSVLSALEGTFLTLAGVAPWLFAGTVACLLIALTRGLPECVRELRAGPAGPARRRSPAGPRAERGIAGAQPEDTPLPGRQRLRP